MTERRSQFACVVVVILLLVPLLGCSRNGGAEQSEASGNKARGGREGTKTREAGSGSGPSAEKGTPEGTRHLFIIERSKNANIVRYDAHLTEEGKLDPEKPVVAYWVLHADEGQRAELSWVQRKMAYGFEVEPRPSGDGYRMTMVPLPDREIIVKKAEGIVRAELKIEGRRAVLEKIYVDSKSTLTGVKVNYVELFGSDVETGEKRYEKIVPQ